MFLFNSEVGDSKLKQRPLMQELTDALVSKKRQNRQIQIVMITDPINSVYGGISPEHYRQLRQAGVDVIETNLAPLRASNPFWSGFGISAVKILAITLKRAGYRIHSVMKKLHCAAI